MEEIKVLGQPIDVAIYGRKAYWMNWLFCHRVRIPRAVFLPAINCGRLQELIQKHNFKETLWACLEDKLKGCERYAIRSSALDEDGKYSSMAGAYTSILNVVSDDVISAVFKVINGAGGKKIGVIVQEMIDSSSGGVLFSSNPLNANKKEILLNMVNGSNYNLMGGVRTGESFVCSKRMSLGIPKYQVNVDKINLLKLLLWSQYIEKMQNRPVDIEWCISKKKNKLYFLQCRPVTGIFPVRNGVFKVQQSMSRDIPEYLMVNDKVQLRLEAQKNGILVSDAYLMVSRCISQDLPIKDINIPKSKECKGYSIVMTYPKRDNGKILRSFVGDRDYAEEENDERAVVIKESPYQNIVECLEDYYKRVHKKYWSCAVIIQEIFEPIYTGSLCRLRNGYIIEIGKGHFLPKGMAPVSRYICGLDGRVLYSREVPCWSYTEIIEGKVIQRTCKKTKPKWIRIAEHAADRIIKEFEQLADENTIIEFGILNTEKCQPYLIDFTREKGQNAMTVDSLQAGVISQGNRTGRLVYLSTELGNQALEIHLYNKIEQSEVLHEKCIFYADMPSIEYAEILEKYDPGCIGFVFSEGSALCHFSLLLREKGIPAITGIDFDSLVENQNYRLNTESEVKLEKI